MTRADRLAIVGCGLGLLCFAGCGSAPALPVAPSAPPVPQIAGMWVGTATDSSGPGTMTWTLTQSSTTVSGSVSVSTPLRTVVLTGTITGTISESTLVWKMDVPAGGVSGQPACTVLVTGTSTIAASGLTMNGSYSGSGSCSSAFTNGSITLTKG